MRKLRRIIGIGSLVILLAAGSLYFIFSTQKMDSADQVGFSYLEDPTGQMKLDEIKSPSAQNNFTQTDTSTFSFGRTHSAFWIRMDEKIPGAFRDDLAVYCPNLQDAVLYVPAENGYQAHYSGWENSRIRDEEMTYPVFPLKENRPTGEPVYLRVQSCYVNNFTVYFYTQKEYNHAKALDFCLNGFLFGILFTIVIINIIIYFKLKSKLCLSFALCVLLISAHQGCSTGIYNILFPKHANLPMGLSMQIGALYLISIIYFFLVFSEGTDYGKRDSALLKLLIAACILLIPFCWVNAVAVNFFGHLLSVVSPVYIFYLSLRLFRSGQKKQIFFLTGWSITVLLYLLITLYVENMLLLPSNSMFHHTALICMVTVSLIFSIALTEQTKQAYIESLKTKQKYQLASEQVRKTEAALLQTQIKPHFLYNTLTAIESLCASDSQKAQNAIADFADYLRSNIDFSAETRLITIEKELENVKHYMSLEKMRFEERLNIIYDIRAGDFLLPALVVQPIVENAVRYGVMKRPEGGTVKITVAETESSNFIFVSDNGPGFDPAKVQDDNHTHIGIRNAKDRVSNLCGGTLTVESRIGAGTIVTITLPKRSIANEYSGN